MKNGFLILTISMMGIMAGNLALAKGSKDQFSVTQVKVDISENQIDQALQKMNLTIDSAIHQKIYFFDTPKLELFKKNVILRARVAQDSQAKTDLTVKIRPINPAQVSDQWLQADNMNCNYDMTTSSIEAQCQLKNALSTDSLSSVVATPLSLQANLTSQQIQFATTFGESPLPWQAIQALGPVESYDWEVDQDNLTLSFELWQIGTHRFLEVSSNASVDQQNQIQTQLKDWTSENGLTILDDGENKTEFIMQILSSQP